MGTPIKNPLLPFNRVARMFLSDALFQLEVNAKTQRVYPTEVYAGYAVVNQKRKEMGLWYSTGQGVNSFAGRVAEAGENGNVTMVFSFNDYLRYAEMGVGRGTKYEDVEGGKKAHYQSRYIARWNRRMGMSQRPFIMMELRHVQKRTGDYLSNYYGYEGMLQMVHTFEEISPIVL